MENPSTKTTGPSYDLETKYLIKHAPLIETPSNRYIPFDRQGMPLPDPYQQHTTPIQIHQMSENVNTNPLPFMVWHGTFRKQINQGSGFLSVNEVRWS